MSFMIGLLSLSLNLLSPPGAFAAGAEVSVHRLYNAQSGETIYSIHPTQGTDTQDQDEGVAFHVLQNRETDTTGLFRCMTLQSGKYSVANQPTCNGLITESLYGYVYAGAGAGRVALYSLVKPESGDQIVTTNPEEASAQGYTSQSILGYVPAN
ncbi:MAG: hypothetical protein P4M08_12900 [Oligoflexia bacterium]|nr:hypothetical protein [Oligoflexia bacterium]